jgi:NADPH-dependent 7-cyano-7-deazaguanine reductase QueF-like protein
MRYNEYINQISFKVLQPNLPVEEFLKSNDWVKKAITSGKSTGELEILNTEIPGAGEDIKRLYELLNIPRMSTFAIAAIINKAVSLMSDELSFVNVGVWNGFTLLSGMMNNPGKVCVGVDNFSQFGGPRKAFLGRFNKYRSPAHSFYDMDYREYFLNHHSGMIGAYLYDGEHGYENQFEGLRVAEPFFADGCVVFVDDTNWSDPKSATLDFISQSSNHYKVLFDKGTCHNRHPTVWNGFMVLQCDKYEKL